LSKKDIASYLRIRRVWVGALWTYSPHVTNGTPHQLTGILVLQSTLS
jgi:hypothetical protein